MSKLIGLTAALAVMLVGCASSLLARHDLSKPSAWVLAGRTEPDASVQGACRALWVAGYPGWAAPFAKTEERYIVQTVSLDSSGACNAKIAIGDSENTASTDGWFAMEGQFSNSVFSGVTPHNMYRVEISFAGDFLRGSEKLTATPAAGPYMPHIQYANVTAIEAPAPSSSKKVVALTQ